MSKLFISTFLLSFFTVSSMAQDTLSLSEVLDERYGIDRYDVFVKDFKNDTSRSCGDRPCSDFVEDYYTTGQLLHKGFYAEGKLTGFKNFYKSGEVERRFSPVDAVKSKMKIFYENGELKSEVLYDRGEALEWTDYYTNGNVEYEEKFHKSFEYLKYRNTYFESGQEEQTLELYKKKNLIYSQSEYYENGQVKTEGKAQYDNSYGDYVKIGEWDVFDENGALIKRLNYVHGKASEIKIEE